MDQHIQAFPHSKKCHQLISATLRMNNSSEIILQKNSWKCWESNPGPLGEKRECYLCATPAPLNLLLAVKQKILCTIRTTFLVWKHSAQMIQPYLRLALALTDWAKNETFQWRTPNYLVLQLPCRHCVLIDRANEDQRVSKRTWKQDSKFPINFLLLLLLFNRNKFPHFFNRKRELKIAWTFLDLLLKKIILLFSGINYNEAPLVLGGATGPVW